MNDQDGLQPMSQPIRVAVATPYSEPVPSSPSGLPLRPMPKSLQSSHTNGRREDRLADAMTRVRKTTATIMGPRQSKGTITGPITRATPKRPAGISARQWKKLQHAGRVK